ncbi:MAG: prolyl-tRNA synthetase associated domain-containing protein [Prevotellaceae bacterium]|nr:prolyl-tRNA synthetase associated domain-containing protein [Prevotellaceae bacterium]MDO4931751.1 prolyl-tRNA synthetase associated domain-containing protein [Prevotellaceae bacterium]
MKATEYKGHPPYKADMSIFERNTYTFLDKLGVNYTTLYHSPVFTMEECAEVENKLGTAIPKNLFLCNRQKTQFYLLMMPGSKVFKTRCLSAELGCARLSFADERNMSDILGIHPGAVSPMGLINDAAQRVLLVIDKELLQCKTIGCHPCVNTATVRLSMEDLLQKVVPQSGHEFRTINLKTES